MPGKVRLRVTAGPLEGQTFLFEEHDSLVFGRAPDCKARLPEGDKTASRRHFLLEVNPPQVRLRDLASLNGTYINGVRHGARARDESPEEAAARRSPEVSLRHGDIIKVGSSVFSVEVERAAEAAGETVYADDADEHKPVDATEYEAGLGAASAVALLLARSRGLDPKAIEGYEVGEKLGEGAMGAVYRARRVASGEEVALKVLLARGAVDEGMRRRFQREIKALRDLSHPHIVRLIDHGEAGGGFYFASEFCEGGSVADLMDRVEGRLPLRESCQMVLQALEGLAYAHAHARTYVHRDIKPQNLLVTSAGEVKLGDFGLAKSLQQSGLSGMSLTGEDDQGGSFPFMSREQVTNFKGAGAESDIWSMGATLYCMVTGQLPRDFHPEIDPVDVILTVDTVSVSERDPKIPAPIAAVIDRAIADDPAQRFRTAAEFREALAAAL